MRDKLREKVLLDLDEIVENPRNPRKHPNHLILSLVRQFLTGVGYRDEIEVDENNMVLAGHARKKALIQCRDKGVLGEVRGLVGSKVPVTRYLDLTEREKASYLVANNKEGEKSIWDFPKLKDLLVDDSIGMAAGDYDLELTGFFNDELDRLFGDTQSKSRNSSNGDDYEICESCGQRILK